MSDSESESASSDQRDESDLDDDLDQQTQPQTQQNAEAQDQAKKDQDQEHEHHDDASKKDGDDKAEADKKSEADPTPDPPEYGLLYEDTSWGEWHEYDVVVVHSIRETSWTTGGWRQGEGSKSATSWMYSDMGFSGCRYLHFQYDYHATDQDRPDVLYRGGIERVAQSLLDGLLDLRQKFNQEVYPDAETPPRRGIVFVAHDVGGTIVKKALLLAALNPSKYGDIPFDTTNLVFLGCPHKGIRIDIEDQVAKLLLMPENAFQDWVMDAITELSLALLRINDEFLDSKVLHHASVYNIASKGVGPDNDIPAPWTASLCCFNLPYEYVQNQSGVHHLKLAEGDEAADDEGDKFARAISSKLNNFPFFTLPPTSIAQFRKTFLAMSPPARPAVADDFSWLSQYHDDAIVKHANYKSWSKQRAPSVLHIHNSAFVRIYSEKLWDYLFYENGYDDPLTKNMAYFGFKRNDCRFNTVDRLLTFMITQVVSRNNDVRGIVHVFDMLQTHRAWTTQDLVQMFISCHDMPGLRPMGFFIGCLDECDESVSVLLDLIAEFRTLSEKRFRFILTTTTGANEELDKALAVWPSIDLSDLPKGNEKPWSGTFERRFGFHVKRLLEKKPMYARFQDQVKEVLLTFDADDRLGEFAIRWLTNCTQDDSKAGIKKTLARLKGANIDSFLEMIVDSFGPRQTRARSLLSWVDTVFQPLTRFELGIAVELSEGATEEDLEDVFFDEITKDIRQFWQAFHKTYEVDVWHVWSNRKQPTAEESAMAHGELARQCLRYLSFPSVSAKVQDMCDRFVSLDETPSVRPREDLVSYAVLYWPKHYALAGTNQPKKEAAAFFEDKNLRNAWAAAHYVFSNHMVRTQRGYLSALPVVAMSGLDDIVSAHIAAEKSSELFVENAGHALVEAIRNGHKSTAKLIADAVKPRELELRDAISAAAAVGDVDVLDSLIELASKTEQFAWPPELFSRAAWLGLTDTAKKLRSHGVKFPEPEGTFASSLLHIAIEGRHQDMVQFLIDEKCDIEVKDEFGNTPLAHASWEGCPDIIKKLLAAGAKPGGSDDPESEEAGAAGIKPIHRAVANAKPKAVRALLEGGAATDVGVDELENSIEDTLNAKPLIMAAANGYAECVSALLDHGADLKAVLGGRTALWHAATRGHVDVCRLLLEKGADPNETPEEWDNIMVAVIGAEDLTTEEIREIVELLLKHGARVDEQPANKTYRSNAICRAAGYWRLKELVEFLLDKGAPVDLGVGVSQTPLWVASYERNEEVVKLLLDKGADVTITSDWGWAPLHAAYDAVNIVKILLAHGADINQMSDTGTLAYIAAKFNQVETLKALLEHGTKPDFEKPLTYKPDLNLEEYEDGMTPLCIACKNGHVDVMRLLLENGANPKHQTKDGSFPLEFCLDTIADDPGPVMETLLEFRPDLTQSDNAGNTVLHNIGPKTPLSAVKMLYTAGADISAINREGRTPLVEAVEAQNSEIAKFLIDKKTDVNVYNAKTGTVLHSIVSLGMWDVFEAAMAAGADVHLAHRRGYKETLLSSALDGSWSEDREKIVRYLLEEAKVDPDEKCNDDLWHYPLIKCANNHYADAIKLLLTHGANPNITDPQGRRPVHVAAYRYWDIVEPLIEGGADPLPRDKSGMTPLHFAAGSASYYFIETLKGIQTAVEGEKEEEKKVEEDKDAKPKKKKKDVRFPKPKVDVNDKDADGWTVLMWLSKANFAYEWLIESVVNDYGADLWVTAPVIDASGRDRVWSPLKAARYFGSSDAVYEALTPKEKTRKLPDGTTETWDDELHSTRVADLKQGWTCDHCLTGVAGLNWKCRNCAFNLCYKCARSAHLLHPDHEFEAEGPEFAPLPDVTSEKSGTPTEDAPTPFNADDTRTETDDDTDDDDDDNDTLGSDSD
ncbi:ankyrin repeat-containing domain protein [Echria macrotheca]|uniref:Ankyrin repeat-containing domain protein n=1 Tax=Echria macrotheca TaxID=438768 RepID=A0AAJ0F6X1_9PEZI|nr:ankyrin repeat-containing domain protein [Echria macrotheca]